MLVTITEPDNSKYLNKLLHENYVDVLDSNICIYIRTHTQIHIHVCVCVCVCVFRKETVLVLPEQFQL